jgi:non-ribosomal peptide synthetase component F/acyl carrier protein
MPPRTPYEEAILAIWSDVLGCSDFGVYDDFFELGGHSLLAPKVVARIRKTLGVHIPVMDFFESPTVAALASVVAAQSSAEPRVVSRRSPNAEPVLSFDQQRLWLENQLLPGAAYNVHGRRRLVGAVDVAALEASVRAILMRHEALRTRFPVVDGRPVQVVDDLDDDWHLHVEDLTSVDGDRADIARRLADGQASTPFDLAAGPLFRCLLVRLSDTEYVLSITMHHIISDAWSVGLFVRELSALYQVGGDVDRTDLPALSVQYRDYAVWQRGRLVGETLEREVSYWREHLDGASPALTMPAAHRRAVARQSGDRVRAELSKEKTVALHELCRKHGVSPFMALLATLATVLGRWSGQRDVVIGVPIAGRTDAGTDTLIGFFVNTLPIRVDLSGDPTFAELLGRVRQVSLDGYAHSEAPVDVLVEELQVTRDPRRTPLFEVILNVIGSPEAEQISGVAVEPMDTPALPSKFDLALNAQESHGALQFHLDFNADRYKAPMVRALVSHLETLLRAAVEDPTKGILDYDFQPASPTPVDRSAPALFERPAPPPERVAVVDADGEWTYQWLGRAADLIAQRIPRSEHLGVVRRPTAAFIAAVLACVKAGASYSVIEADSQVPLQYLGVSAVLDVADGSVDLSGTSSPSPGHSFLDGGWAVERFGLTSDDRFAALSNHPGLLISAVSSAFAAGATLFMPPSSFSGDISTWLQTNAINVVYVNPPQLRALAGPLPALRYAFVDNSGELISHDIESLHRLSPTCRLIGVYRVGRDGRPLATYEVPDDWRLPTAPLRVPLGTELPGTPTRLRHPAGQPATVGEVAEMCFGTYQTGDLARRWTDGTLEFVAKLGASLTSDPVETVAALRDVPDVADAVVTELVDADGNPTLVGYVTGPDPSQGAAAIRQSLVVRLPEYLIPKHLFVLDSLPRTPDGDYDLSGLPEPDEGSSAVDSYVAPRTPIERGLTEIFEELLGVEQVGVHDTFFELNGFSLLATRLASRIRETFKVELSLREVFGSPTVESLAQLILRTQSELSNAEELEALLNEIGSGR